MNCLIQLPNDVIEKIIDYGKQNLCDSIIK